jgi:hypothetical protein
MISLSLNLLMALAISNVSQLSRLSLWSIKSYPSTCLVLQMVLVILQAESSPVD